MKNKLKIDLHNIRHQSVFDVIEKSVRDKLRDPCSVEIITGRSQKMQQEVVSAFLSMGFKESDIRIYPSFLLVEW